MSELDIFRAVYDLGLSATLIVGGIRGWYVFGWLYLAQVKRADQAEQEARDWKEAYQAEHRVTEVQAKATARKVAAV
jgi:hypothetical protein